MKGNSSIQVMGFETGSASLKWEIGYWGGTLKKWYRQGLYQKIVYIKIPKKDNDDFIIDKYVSFSRTYCIKRIRRSKMALLYGAVLFIGPPKDVL
jgi:hypothetical protein